VESVSAHCDSHQQRPEAFAVLPLEKFAVARDEREVAVPSKEGIIRIRIRIVPTRNTNNKIGNSPITGGISC
jgi:hypothetical protein